MIFLVIKKRTKPHLLLSYEALFRRLKDRYRNNSTINKEYANEIAGYRGEQTVDYKISLYPQRDFHIFQGLRLKINNNYFQIDNLILTNKFILIIEVKNIKGELEYNSNSDQLTRTYGNVKDGFISPILQANMQETQLRYWLQQKLSVYGVPIESIAVVSDPSTIINNTQNDPLFYDKMIHVESLVPKIKMYQQKYDKVFLKKATLNSISDALVHYDTPLQTNLILKFNLSEGHFIKGNQCQYCGDYPMNRLLRKWECPNCLFSDLLPHQRVILDYFLLHKSTITNRECRDHLQLNSTKTSYAILKSMDLVQTGENKARK